MPGYTQQSAVSTPVDHYHLTSVPSVDLIYCWLMFGCSGIVLFRALSHTRTQHESLCVRLCLCVHLCMRVPCAQSSTAHAELPGFLDPGALTANLVAATAHAEGVLTDTNPSREHEHCPLPLGEYMLLCWLP